MKKNIYIKLFTFCLVFFLSAISVFAEEINSLKQIIIQPLSNKEYTLNLLFDNEYQGKAFLQKSGKNGYYIFLPDSTFASKKVNINYVNPSDKRNIRFLSETKPLIKNKVETKYIKVTVFMNDNYKIKLISGLNKDYHPIMMELKKSVFSILIILFVFAVCSLILFKNIKKMLNESENNSYTSFPVNINYSDKITREEPVRTIENRVQRVIIPKNNIKKTFSSQNENKFGCFNIDSAAKPAESSYEIKSSLNETSNILKDKSNTVKLKHTNPITKNNKIEETELSIPMADEVLSNTQKQQANNEKEQPEILSILNLAPNKGFYLMSDENSFKLFGFIQKQIFLLETFKDLTQINLQARFYDKSGNNDIYIVRLDSYKAMIEISDSSMKELAKV